MECGHSRGVRRGHIVSARSSARIRLRPGRGLLLLGTSARTTLMPDNNKSTTAVIRALLDQMAEALTKPKPQPLDEDNEFIPPPLPRRRTRVNVKEFNKAKDEEGGWWDSSGDGDPFIALRPRPKRRGPRR